MTEINNFQFKVGDKVIKNGNPTIYVIKSVFMVKPVYYEAIGELGNIEYLPENKISLLTNKYHDELVKESKNYHLDPNADDEFYDLFVYPKKSEQSEQENISELDSLKKELLDIVNKRKEYAAIEKSLRGKITELEMIDIGNELKDKGVGKYAR